MPRNLRVEGAGELRGLARQLKGIEARKDIMRELRKALRAAGRPMVPAVRASVLSLPSRGESARRGRRSLRRSIASATRLDVNTGGARAGVTVRVHPRKMPDGQRALPALLEGADGPWRHPLFGNREVWMSQAAHPYFAPAVNPLIPRAERLAEDALDNVADQIERG